MRRIRSGFLAFALLLATPSGGVAGLGDCSQPETDGAMPAASDCLFILRAATGSVMCQPACICAPAGTLPAVATDALRCLQKAVGQTVTLDCPCPGAEPTTFAEASDEAVARLDEVLDAVGSMFEAGSTFEELAMFLETEPDVDGIHFNGATIYFRVAGIPTSAHDGFGARLDGIGESNLTAALPFSRQSPRNAAAVNLLPGGMAETDPPIGQRVLGADEDRENATDLTKKALVLAPYAFQFGIHDSAAGVADTLEALPDYTQVDRAFNTQGGVANSVRLSVWAQDWSDYDIVFVSTHGDFDPSSSYGTEPTLSLGVFGENCDELRDEIFTQLPFSEEGRTGIFCDWTNVSPNRNVKIWRKGLVAVPRFFSAVHEGELDKKIVYVDACRSGRDDGLAGALTGQDSIFLGWDDYVRSDVSRNAANEILAEAAGNGFPMWRSFVRACSDGSCMESFPPRNGRTKRAELLVHHDRADLRIREGLILSGQPFAVNCSEIAMVPLSVSCPTCVGMDPAAGILFEVTMEGVTTDDLVLRQDPTDFALEQYRLWGDVDDVEQPYALPIWSGTTTSLGDGAYEVTMPQLFMDGVCPGQMIDYRPKVLLPAFDPIMSGNDARDWLYSLQAPYMLTIGDLPPIP